MNQIHPVIQYFVIPAAIGSLAGFVIAAFYLPPMLSLIVACVAAGIAGFIAVGRRADAAI
jgi:hypothetical protein